MDTIAAIATGKVPTAIGVIRVSGPGTDAVLNRVFCPKCRKIVSELEPRKLFLGDLLDAQGRVLDSGMAVRFPAPGSYTGEDSAELHCHGSPVAMGEILSALFAAGARQARAGEFTKRAFLNGKLDLTQAEAVIDLIDAETPAAARNAAAQLDGALGRALSGVYDALTAMASQFYAVVDYPDEDIEDLELDEIKSSLRQSDEVLTRLLATCGRGRLLKSGVRTAIVGRPNAGKSSLLNALAGFDRCLVTDVPGTTRDTVEESVLCGGVLLRLIDTAGIRDTEDRVEKLGVERSKVALKSADLALAVVDGTALVNAAAGFAVFSPEDYTALELAAACPHWILVVSKSDLMGVSVPIPKIPPALANPPAASVCVSSATGEGLDVLENAVAALFPTDAGNPGELLTDPRQTDAVSRARDAIRRGLNALESGLTPDVILTDTEEAMNALGELTGRTAREDIVSAIFSRFCVGK
ncbi:tRNA uridine-5-carboxymethylaminomethyl(34) synthesis GTPase MnmE [Oscillibacter ruminantium]|uniref:tRNA uridine-5-carboxymethylaminomethyl(34) synthesis GTPase MnmE n=1 Tax=Oscillibacter ruminantium TaxID=1263547 RepID=UPI00030AB6A3|nr:tRNA uridine-5-carboxymethylaminomethyl(34) synthesis GTPase MnmE [Oscillibacter ruminantium]MDN0031392.1 tRNA uridine-5-carboxymethylaminomethyl(34) synthesis GTPase MnmE [Oscillibacter valericigenes]